jgi:hypothetical protein
MKRILILMLALGSLSTAFAQRSRSESRDVILGRDNSRTVYGNDDRRVGTYGNNDRYGSDRRYGNYSLDDQIRRINREYDWKIRNVQNDRRLRNGEKRRQVRMLEQQRDSEIRYARQRFNDLRDNRYGNRNRW